MTASLRTYSADQISVILSDRPVTGLNEVTIERDNDLFSEDVGMAGEVARVKSNDRRGTITLKLMQTSPENDYLSNLFAKDEFTGSSPFGILIRDQNGTSLYESLKSWIIKPASSTFGKELNEREWMIRCADLKVFVGGNN